MPFRLLALAAEAELQAHAIHAGLPVKRRPVQKPALLIDVGVADAVAIVREVGTEQPGVDAAAADIAPVDRCTEKTESLEIAARLDRRDIHGLGILLRCPRVVDEEGERAVLA